MVRRRTTSSTCGLRPVFKTWISALVGLTIVAAGCTTSSPDDPAGSETFTSVESEQDIEPLDVVYETTEILCNGEDTLVARIQGAEPGEVLAFESSLPIDLADAIAGRDGGHIIRWSCTPEESRLRWNLTAIGLSSGRTATVSFTGTDVEPDDGIITFAAAATPFVCDGEEKPVGTLSGAVPDEWVDVFSSWTGEERHRADGLGEVQLWWNCDRDEAATWLVEVETADVARSLTFEVVGVAADPADLPLLVVAVEEDPFVCDGQTRSFATISNLKPFANVRFSVPDGRTLNSGGADGEGVLTVRWQCSPTVEPESITMTALATGTGQSIDISFSTAKPSPEALGTLTVTMIEDPFVCDGATRVFASIGGLLNDEVVRFTSSTAQDLREGQSDFNGILPLRWSCDPADAGTVWEFTATGQSSLRSTTVTVTGVAPS